MLIQRETFVEKLSKKRMFLKDYGELGSFDNLDDLFDRDKVISLPLRRGRARVGVDVLTGKRTEDRVTARYLQRIAKFY